MTFYDESHHIMKKKRSNIEIDYSNKRFKQENKKSQLEDLPNELFYKIFSYLTDGELFKSFDFHSRNHRFNQLILHRTKVNFHSIERYQYFENRDKLNPKLINEINLFNDDDTPGIINSFFMFYSFDLFNTFPNLQTLILDQPEQTDLLKLMKYFNRLKHLSIRLNNFIRMPSAVYTNLYSSISSSINLKSLTIIDDPNEEIYFTDKIHFSSLKYLTLGLLTLFDVEQILQSSINLIYFKFHLNSDRSNYQLKENFSTNIKRIDLTSENAEFNLIEILLKRMKKLKSLKLICRATDGFIWQNFIENFLPNLIDFQFKFDIQQKTIDLINYQNDWWINNKKWIVVLHPLTTFIYTIPLIDTKFILNSRTNNLRRNEYSNIRQLIITLNSNGFKLCRSDEIYFHNVEHLTLINYQYNDKLQKIIYLNKIRHLTIDDRMTTKTFLLLLEQMNELNSLSANDSTLYLITKKFQNNKILSLIKTKIQRISIIPSKPCRNIRYVSQLCFTFSHIHHLTLTIKSTNDIYIWLNNLLDLRSATIFARYGSFFDLINQENFNKFTYELRSHQDLRLWIR